MISLLLDSSGSYLAIALAKDDQIIAQTIYAAWQKQSELLVFEINNLLAVNQIDIKQINQIGVAIGPGSYTGVRIALTVAKIMGFSLNIKVYSLSSLALLKDGHFPTICLINARSNRSYVAIYEGNQVILNEQVMDNQQILKLIDKYPNYHLSGELSYLGLTSSEGNLFINFLDLIKQTEPVIDIHQLKPVYLKDL